jgi:hypothetical protein
MPIRRDLPTVVAFSRKEELFSNFDVQILLSTNVIERAKRVCQLISVEKMHLLRKGSRWICRMLFSPHLSEQQYTW